MNVDGKAFEPRKRPTTMFLFNFSLYDYTQSLSIKWYSNVSTDCGAKWVDERLQETVKKCIFTLFVVFRHLCVPRAITPDEKCGVTIMKSFENLSGGISVSCLPGIWRRHLSAASVSFKIGAKLFLASCRPQISISQSAKALMFTQLGWWWW